MQLHQMHRILYYFMVKYYPIEAELRVYVTVD